jgi:hypothetical protein
MNKSLTDFVKDLKVIQNRIKTFNSGEPMISIEWVIEELKKINEEDK